MTEFKRKTERRLIDAETLKHSIVELMFTEYAVVGCEKEFDALRRVLLSIDAIPAAGEKEKPRGKQVAVVYFMEV